MSIRIPDPQVLANQAGAWKNATDETKESIMKQVRKIENDCTTQGAGGRHVLDTNGDTVFCLVCDLPSDEAKKLIDNGTYKKEGDMSKNTRKNPCHGTTVKGKACGGGAKKNGYCGVHQDQAVCSSCDSGAYLEAGICRVCEGAAQIHEEKEAMMNETCIWCGGPATCRDPHCPGDMTEVLEDNNKKEEETVRKIKCMVCHSYHNSFEEIKECGTTTTQAPKANKGVRCGNLIHNKRTYHSSNDEVRACYANRYNKEVK